MQHGAMILAFSVAPEGNSESLAPAVARAVRVVRESGLPNETSAMFTTVEGEWDEVMDVVRRATEAAGQGTSRVSLSIKADIREGVSDALRGKVDAVERELGNQ